MNRKTLLIVVLAVLVIALSEGRSLIGREHGQNISAKDMCANCHGDIRTQLSASARHSSHTCAFCHPDSAVNHTGAVPGCPNCHNATQKLNGTLEAHTNFAALGTEGCIACHTTYNTVINYSRPEYIDYAIADVNGNWVILNFSTIGTLNISDNAQRNGGSHELKEVSCKDCHQDIFSAAKAGGHAVILSKNGSQVPYHSNVNSSLEAWCRTCHGRNDTEGQHSARRAACDGCHESYDLTNNGTAHPGNFYAGIKSIPKLYRSLVCIACKSVGWPVPNSTIHFRVHQEPYSDITVIET